jgi:hypothetical protein
MLYSTTFSKNLSLRFSLNVSDQVSHPYKTTGVGEFKNILKTLVKMFQGKKRI